VTIRVRLFAVLRDRAGLSELALDLPQGATVAQAREPLVERLPSLREHLDRCSFAVNFNYVRTDATLHDGDELALIPPVSGG
jgi:molybdopterin converting factor subunit 1